jgi:hypothetical protein
LGERRLYASERGKKKKKTVDYSRSFLFHLKLGSRERLPGSLDL